MTTRKPRNSTSPRPEVSGRDASVCCELGEVRSDPHHGQRQCTRRPASWRAQQPGWIVPLRPDLGTCRRQHSSGLSQGRPGCISMRPAGPEVSIASVSERKLKLYGAGEWLVEKHGTKTRRSWRKLHLGRDADTGRIVAATLTDRDVDDASQVGPLLDQVDGQIDSFTGDGAYDQDGVYASVAERHPEAAIIVPPRATAVPSRTAETAPTQRDRHLQLIAEKGRMGWQKASGYNWRARAEMV